ncbi:unnamed protein product, partial [Adineta steineri]
MRRKKRTVAKIFNDDLSKHLRNLEMLSSLYGNGGEYFVSANLILADLALYDAGETVFQLDANCLNNHPWHI